MIPGNVDPRRAEKVQRYKAPQQANGNAPVEDLTPDYMNILGPDSATANADGIDKNTDCLQHHPQQLPQQQQQPPPLYLHHDELTLGGSSAILQTSANGSSVIPTSPQYGVAIISNNSNADVPTETTTPSTDSLVESTARVTLPMVAVVEDAKDMQHSTPSRNDRFKVVKIASLEPFRRGRWKCMDYVDENPPPVAQQQAKQTQSATNLQQMNSVQYLQTQSLPQQHFQQLLVQGTFSGSPQAYYQGVPGQIPPQSQYFYPAPAGVNLHTMPVQANSIQPQSFINNQQYFPNAAGYTTYANVQYVPSNLIQTQSSAFVATSQNVPANNFQQSQTYAGPPSGNTANSQQQQQQQAPSGLVNGHAFPTAAEQTQQAPNQQPSGMVASSLPTQIAKNVILQQPPQQYNPVYNPSSIPPSNPSPHSQASPAAPIIANHMSPATNTLSVNSSHSTSTTTMSQNYDTNPQFDVTSSEGKSDAGGETNTSANTTNAEMLENVGEDPAKSNPLVNAIDNKIEQAMDLVKSHLMYTVREEVEVLKEKIVELMERIQQLETENAMLRQQIPKGLAPQTTANGTATNATDGSTPDPTQQQPPPLSSAPQVNAQQQQQQQQ